MNDSFKQSLTGFWKEMLHVNRALTFPDIIGHDNIKQIFQKATLSKKPVHLNGNMSYL